MLIARARQLLRRVNQVDEQLDLKSLGEAELRKRCLALRYRVKSGEASQRLLPECYALVREAAQRQTGMRHFDVQVLGGIVMYHKSIAEMQTGEGKTLTATLPMALASLDGKGTHLATVNDYLAARDAEWMSPVYRSLGLSVGVIQTEMSPAERRRAYACDVTYGTAKEFGFDFLRDRLLKRRVSDEPTALLNRMLGEGSSVAHEQAVQRPAHFVLVDEADSILIDEARTPLIISALPTEAQKVAVKAYQWSAEVENQFREDEHYEYEHEQKKVELNAAGRRLVRSLSHPEELDAIGMISIYEYIERAIKVGREFVLDRHYVDHDGEIVIVDEFTGRLAEGRRWRAGIHQAVEAKEGVKVTVETGQAARITVQDYFLRYKQLAGMTGTASTSARELKKIYKLDVVTVPTNMPLIRERLPEQVFADADKKWAAIIEEIKDVHQGGRPVLVGTRSIDKSEILSRLLTSAGIEHLILNANHVAAEADIIAQAGRLGAVTISTNMAGRGTDIILGGNPETLAWAVLREKYQSRSEVPPEVWDECVERVRSEENLDEEKQQVIAQGGLHVICTEWHESQRVDRQLMGRCGRQGDPGSCRLFGAMDDDILEAGLGPKKAERLEQSSSGGNGPAARSSSLFRKAQKRVERRHFRDRKALMYHEKLRKKIQIQMGQDPFLDTPGN